jgi:hypothetical protein
MRTAIPPQSQFETTQCAIARGASAPGLKCWHRLPSFARTATIAALIAAAALTWAQTPAAPSPAPASAAAKKPIHSQKHAQAHVPVTPEPAAPAPDVTPPVPETPKWPAFDHPADASVVWDSRGLTIGAANSSLQQILKDVSAATGVKVEGMNSDERVFGAYGPGQARDVLAQLLQGSGYNVIMIGDQGQGTPRQLLLSARASANNPRAAARNPANDNNGGGDEDDTDEVPVTQEDPPVRNFPPGQPPRTPQQIMQEMQQRQQQMQQQQQQPGQPQPLPQPQE